MTSNEYEAVAAAADFNPQLLHTYYHKLFPADLIAQWTTHNLDKREWSYTLDNDIYVRFQAFSTPQLLKEDIRRKLPHKIDIGAVYNARPTMKTAVGKFVPVQREFVFDIDLTDYSDVRACCEGASACDKCWTLMKAAMKVIDTALREDFDFQHILWVYSGRRGIHCWVCDQHVSKFDNEQRAKLVDYFTVFQGNEHSAVKVSPDAINHPAVRRAYELLKPIFEKEWISDQNILTRKEGLNQLLGLIQFNELRSEAISKIEQKHDDQSKWEALKKVIEKSKVKQNYLIIPQIVLSHLYPRLDANVSKQMNHLLKAPFCVHPKTGRVCVPIDPLECDAFKPSSVPTMQQLSEELDRKMDSGEECTWSGTSIEPYIDYFKAFVHKLNASQRKAARAEAANSMEF